MNEHNFSVITLVIILFQNKAEISSILKEIFGDDEEVDAREQDDNICVMTKERMAVQMLQDSVCGMKHSLYNIYFQYSSMKT